MEDGAAIFRLTSVHSNRRAPGTHSCLCAPSASATRLRNKTTRGRKRVVARAHGEMVCKRSGSWGGAAWLYRVANHFGTMCSSRRRIAAPPSVPVLCNLSNNHLGQRWVEARFIRCAARTCGGRAHRPAARALGRVLGAAAARRSRRSAPSRGHLLAAD